MTNATVLVPGTGGITFVRNDEKDTGYPVKMQLGDVAVPAVATVSILGTRADRGILFSSRIIEELAVRYVKRPDLVASGQKVAQLSIAPEQLTIAMTLANREGIKRVIDFQGDETGRDVIFYTDKRVFRITDGGGTIRAVGDTGNVVADMLGWRDVSQTAIASGSFPFAFPTKKLLRLAGEVEPESRVFRYVDGGFFNNNPFQFANDIAADTDTMASAQQNRRFVFLSYRDVDENKDVDPTPAPTADGEGKPGAVGEWVGYVTDIVNMALGAASSVDNQLYLKGQAGNRDNLNRLLAMVRVLAESDKADSADQFLGTVRGLSKKYRLSRGAWVSLDSSGAKTAQENIDFFRDLAPPELEKEVKKRLPEEEQFSRTDARTAWLFRAAETTDRRRVYAQLYIALFDFMGYERPSKYVVIANDDSVRLAGSSFAHFGGFLNRSIRLYDYQLGRYFAQRKLKDYLGLDIAGGFPDTVRREFEQEFAKQMNGKTPDEISTVGDHLPGPGALWDLRQRLNRRAELMAKTLEWVPRQVMLEGADVLFDRMYHTPKTSYVFFYKGAFRKGYYQGGLLFSPWNFVRQKWSRSGFPQIEEGRKTLGLGGLLSTESYLVVRGSLSPWFVDAGVVQRLPLKPVFGLCPFKWIKPVVRSIPFAGAPLWVVITGTKLMPEFGVRRTSKRFRTDLESGGGDRATMLQPRCTGRTRRSAFPGISQTGASKTSPTHVGVSGFLSPSTDRRASHREAGPARPGDSAVCRRLSARRMRSWTGSMVLARSGRHRDRS